MMSVTQTLPTGLFGRMRGMLANKFARNLGIMGMAQIAIRISRLGAILFLGHLLSPKDYGLAAIVLTVYEFVSLFTRNGISASVLKAAPENVAVTAMTAYRMIWIVCIGLMIIQCGIALPIAWFYQDHSLALPIAAMAIIYLATPLCAIQGAFQQREGHLGRIALAGAVQVVVDNCLTALFAIMGFGLWAIVLPKILVAPIWVIFVRYGHEWRPHDAGAPSLFYGWREISRFSRHVMGVEILTTVQANLDNLLVGYFLGVQALGLYYFAFNGGLGITLGLINGAAVAVFPHLCAVNHDADALAARFRGTQKTMAYTLVPLILAQSLLAPIYVPIVFGSKWVSAVPVLSIICLSALARPFASVCSQLLKAIGRPDYELKWQIATTIILSCALLAAAQINIVTVAAAVLIVQTLLLGAFTYAVSKKFLVPTKHL